MKAVLISIQPKWIEKIVKGEKTIEVRKTRPKLEVPFKCYIYETIEKVKEIVEEYDSNFKLLRRKRTTKQWGGKVIGEFVCDRIDEYRAEFTDLQYSDARHKEVCQNTIKWVEDLDEEDGVVYRYETSNEEDNPDDCKFLKESCLTFNEVRKYIGETFFDIPFYGWHITDLKIYDKPKGLSEFTKYMSCKHYYDCCACHNWDRLNLKCIAMNNEVKRPPQSWQFIEIGE